MFTKLKRYIQRCRELKARIRELEGSIEQLRKIQYEAISRNGEYRQLTHENTVLKTELQESREHIRRLESVIYYTADIRNSSCCGCSSTRPRQSIFR